MIYSSILQVSYYDAIEKVGTDTLKMKKIWLKIILPIAIVSVGFGGMQAIKASAAEDKDKETVDTRPTVKIESALAQDYQVKITSFGEVKPLESTNTTTTTAQKHWQTTHTT